MIHFKRSKPQLGVGGSRLELTPLIDAIFILLLFFAVSTTLKTTKGIPILLPVAETSAVMPKQITVSIDQVGALFLNGTPVEKPDLAEQIELQTTEFPDLMINLQADQLTPYEKVVSVIDLVQLNGGFNLALETRTSDRESKRKD